MTPRTPSPRYLRIAALIAMGLGSLAMPALATIAEQTVAILPLTDRSGRSAPLTKIQEALTTKLQFQGLSLLESGVLEVFMRRHRMRHTAGINKAMGEALRTETGTHAALITTVDLYDPGINPKLGLTVRLVALNDNPRILWMESATRAGNQSPGFLGLGVVTDFDRILNRVCGDLGKSFSRYRESAEEGKTPFQGRGAKPSRRFRPRVFYARRSFPIVRDQARRVAVLPFRNESTTPWAGDIVTDQLVRHLVQQGAEVMEPGVVRQVLLTTRQIYQEGPSVPDTDILRVIMEAEVALFGEVSEYLEAVAGNTNPVVDFWFRAFDTHGRRMVWSSFSRSHGNQGVVFFDAGQVSTAHDLAARMTRSLVETVRRYEPRNRAK